MCSEASPSKRPEPPGGRFRLVAVDLDGTLLDESREMAEAAASALRDAASRDVKVILASARPPRSVRRFYRALALDTWQINYNGALIWDEPAGRAVRHFPMEGPTVLRMARAARELCPEILVSCEVLDRWYTDRSEPRWTTETARLFAPDRVADLEEFTAGPVTKLMFLGQPDRVSRVSARISAEFPLDVTVIHSEPELLQILARGGSKAAGLRIVAEHHGVPMESVLAIGDALNDVEMLEAAGVGVAVANADPRLREVADWVTSSPSSLGVHEALVRFGVGG